jgi:hypothetical protein
MKRTQFKMITLLLCTGLAVAACGDSSEDGDGGSDENGDGDSVDDGDGDGDGNGSGGGAALDQNALAQNCNGVTAEDGASCSESGRVCETVGGVSCLCGDITDTSGGDDDGGRPRPEDDLTWQCFFVGIGQGGEGNGTGGDAEGNGTGGDAEGNGTGGDDPGSGGNEAGGLGGMN